MAMEHSSYTTQANGIFFNSNNNLTFNIKLRLKQEQIEQRSVFKHKLFTKKLKIVLTTYTSSSRWEASITPAICQVSKVQM